MKHQNAARALQAQPQRPLRDRIREAIEIDGTLTQTRMAREIGQGVSTSTVSQWLSGTYAGDNSKIETRIANWHETYLERRASGGLPEAPEWIATPTAERIQAGLRYAHLAQDMVIIYGPAGVSKSKACEHYATQAPAVWNAVMKPSTNSVVTCLKKIAEAVGIREIPQSAHTLDRMIAARLRGTHGLLIIDESQHLGIQALDQVRSLHDECLIGIALVGNETVYSRMTGGNRAPYLDRLFSRIGKRVALRGPSDADIDALMAGWNIKDEGCRAQIRDIARKPGALRVLTKVLRLAASYSAAQSHAICCDDVRAAWRDLGAME